jgi:ankyrin repeat protein
MRNYFRLATYLIGVIVCLPAFAGAYEDFFRAVEVDDAGSVSTLLARGFDPNTLSESGQVGLFLALRGDSPKVAAVLLASPSVQVDLANAFGETPLMMAALRGRFAAAQKLLDRGATVQRDGWAPVHYAASGPDASLLALLLDRGASINARSPNRNTPLMMAARYGTQDSVKLLVQRGADRQLINDKNLSAADMARQSGREWLLPLLQ